MPRITRITIIGVLSAVALGATACTDSEATTPSDVPADIPYDDGFTKAVLGVTVTSVEPGDQAQYGQVFGADAEGSTPFYVHYTVENLSGADLSIKTLFSLYGSTVKSENGTGVVGYDELDYSENPIVWAK